MIVGGACFTGDTNRRVAWKQHDVYHEALWIIVTLCNRYTNFARLLLDDVDHPRWGTVDRFDHRTLQSAHDLLAAAWRFRSDFGQARLPLDGKNPLDEVQTLWLEWLRHEVTEWSSLSHLVRSVQLILTNQNEPAGYAAESKLCIHILDRFSDVPWVPGTRDVYELD